MILWENAVNEDCCDDSIAQIVYCVGSDSYCLQ